MLYRPAVLGVVASLLFASAASAHYNMLLPSSAFARRGRPVTVLYQWGHPYEHQLFDAPRPEKLVVVDPDGRRTDCTDKLDKISQPTADGKQVTAYRLRFIPQQRGDYVFLLTTPPIWMEDEQSFFDDTVKVVLHVQIQKGWDRSAGGFELVPLTRPYGLQAGDVFQAQARQGDRGNKGALVEIEHYNPQPPRQLPADEFITRTARTDPNGVVTTSLPQSGWWAITALHDGGQRMHAGKKAPVLKRSTLWIPVADIHK